MDFLPLLLVRGNILHDTGWQGIITQFSSKGIILIGMLELLYPYLGTVLVRLHPLTESHGRRTKRKSQS